MNSVQLQIEVQDRQSWLVPPEKLLAELRMPGRTDLPSVFPLRLWTNPSVEEVRCSDLNNFHLHFLPKQREILSTFFSGSSMGMEIVERCQKRSRELSYADFEGHSLRYMTGSREDFWRDVDDSCARARIFFSVDQLQTAIDSKDAAALFEWRQRCGIPVYRSLRALGYSHRDLVG